MQLGLFRPSVDRGDLHQNVFRAVFGVLHEDIKVAILIKHAGIEQFILHLVRDCAADSS